jgi:small ligand-binding sensory domain FIST
MMENQTHSASKTGTKMRFASALTTEVGVQNVSRALIDQITSQMNGLKIDLILAFLSPHFRAVAQNLVDSLRADLEPGLLLGCTAEGVIGRQQEIERASAVTLIAAHLPGVQLTPFSLQSMNWENFLSDPSQVRRTVGALDNTKLLMLLADPFTTPMDMVLDAFNNFYPGLPMIGGMASGSTRAGGNALLLNDRLLNHGAVGAALAGKIDVDVIVSQGCRPIGQTLTVTNAWQNLIYTLEDEPPLVHLQKLFQALSTEDRELLQYGLFLGRAVAPAQEILGRGDFLIRGVMGIDQKSGAMVVSDYIDAGETVQFHLRDASTAEEDLEMMLSPQLFYDPPSGGILFSCNGRGTHLYDHPNGDIRLIQKVVGDINLAGFFCAGEIGPIGDKNFLHGHTASLVLFRPEIEDKL